MRNDFIPLACAIMAIEMLCRFITTVSRMPLSSKRA